MLQIMPRNIWLECFGQNPPLLGPADVLSELIAPPRQPPHLHVLSYCSTATGDDAADQVGQPTRATGEIRERPGRELPERRQAPENGRMGLSFACGSVRSARVRTRPLACGQVRSDQVKADTQGVALIHI